MMQGYERASSFYKFTFHWVDTATGQPLIQKSEEFLPGQNIEIVKKYFPQDTGILIETQPYWFDLLDIVDTDVSTGFVFQIGTFDASKPGFGYLQGRYDDYVKEREAAYRPDY
ncbi:hypothetical protein [Pseudomonas sp. BJa3]|uniref:hypothetical protein n=1 Tax=Pseudomonas sp. BJa3 TaxID=2986525 RepID=UPI0022659B1C|nr:hypothetical protein [Pseudomonas sp. BJa3]MCX5508413.1 hypothetical protein [Pseudomonas sp. BJa3]